MIFLKKIVDIALADISSFGGVETITRNRLSYFSDHGWKIYSISRCPAYPKALPTNSNIEYIFIPRYLSKLCSILISTQFIIIYLMFKIINLFIFKGVSTFHVNDVFSGFAACVLKPILKSNVFITVHGPASYEMQHFWLNVNARKKFLSYMIKQIESFVYRHSDLVMAVSEFEEKFIKEACPGKEVIILRNGVDIGKFKPGRLLVEGISSDNKIVLFVGRMVAKNGPCLVAKAIPQVLNNCKNCYFVFVGDGEMKDFCIDLVKKSGVEKHASFLGYRHDINIIMNASDIFVSHVSSLVDGVGISVFEALSSGLPCIIGKDNISSKLLKDRFNAILIEKDRPDLIASAITELIDNEELASKIGGNARKTSLDTFSIEKQFKEMAQLIEKCLDGKGGS
jgi:glycosyltransferase involved in cell wall biosynthesis